MNLKCQHVSVNIFMFFIQFSQMWKLTNCKQIVETVNGTKENCGNILQMYTKLTTIIKTYSVHFWGIWGRKIWNDFIWFVTGVTTRFCLPHKESEK